MIQFSDFFFLFIKNLNPILSPNKKEIYKNRVNINKKNTTISYRGESAYEV